MGFVNLFPPDLLSIRSQLARVIFHYKPSQFSVTSWHKAVPLSACMVGWAGISHHEEDLFVARPDLFCLAKR